jgi:hypothetical protein
MIMRVSASLLTGMLLATAASSTAPPNLLVDGAGLNEGVLFATLVETGPAGQSGASSPQPAAPKKVAIGKNVWFEIEGKTRRVVFNAYVCFRAGPLEQLLCRRGTKEHEAILAADVDARDIHRALLLTGAKKGSPVRYEPKFQAPSGSAIRVTLRYEDQGKTVTVPAQQWVRDRQSRKALGCDWVFAGSVFVENVFEKEGPPLYAANGGDVICVSNFEDAMLDLPINSSKDNSELEFEAWTDRIPPLDTKVAVILEPIQTKK